MTSFEIAAEITLKAMECGYIEKACDTPGSKDVLELTAKKNQYNATEIGKFFNNVLNVIDKPEE